MKLHLIAVGHRMPGWINAGYDDYARRMPPDLPLVLAEIKPGHRVAGEDGARARQHEAERILAAGSPERVVHAFRVMIHGQLQRLIRPEALVRPHDPVEPVLGLDRANIQQHRCSHRATLALPHPVLRPRRPSHCRHSL